MRRSKKADLATILDFPASGVAANREESNADIPRLKDSLHCIHAFLSENRDYNETTQHATYVSAVSPWATNHQRISSLLYVILMTQSQPSLKHSAITWQKLFANRETFDAVRTAEDLTFALWQISGDERNSDEPSGVFDDMWQALKGAAGFGEKTAALFVKSVVDIHTLEINRHLRFLGEVVVQSEDAIHVPVDSVIIYIFEILTRRTLKFDDINTLIFTLAGRSHEDPTIWDDLWFWGFITQMGNGKTRKLEVNEERFWSIYGAPKHQWAEIRKRAEEFKRILEAARAG